MTRRGPGRVAKDLLKGAARPTYPHTLALVSSRAELPEVLNRRGLLGTGVEVGVRGGAYSEWILQHWRGRQLISVDAWSSEFDPLDEQAGHDHWYARACERLAEFGDRSRIWRSDSTSAAAEVEPHSLDFVYIDARHEYEYVAADLDAWFDRVRPGGLFAGHDYFDGSYAGFEFGVRSAVTDFCARKGLRVYNTRGEYKPARSWLIKVPA